MSAAPPFFDDRLLRDEEFDAEFADAVIEVGRSLPDPRPARAGGHGERPFSTYNLTDLGNAKRLVARHGHKIIFCHAWNRWLIYDATRWRADETGEIFRLAQDTVADIYQEASAAHDATTRKNLAAHASRSEAEGKLKAMVSVAASLVPVTPHELDADPFRFNVLNGTLDLIAGRLRPHDPADKITKRSPVVYDAEATAPTWTAFLNRIMVGDVNLIRFLQSFAGYCMTSQTGEQCLVLAYGTGSNGKSTFIETLKACFGDYAATADFSTFAIQGGDRIRNDLARLHGPRLVTAIEAGDGIRFDEATIKRLTGGDTITARFLHAEYFEFKPAFKLFLAANHKPRIKGTDHAIWRRIRLVPFTVTIPDAEQDKELSAKLLREAPGILRWTFEGCMAYRFHGLGMPDEVKRATASYREEEDPLSDFVDECCATGPLMTASARELYRVYTRWAEDAGDRPTGRKKFGERLAERGFRSGRDNKGQRIWEGISLRSPTS